MKLVCEICERGPAVDGTSLYRNGEIGGDPHWRCKLHLDAGKLPPEHIIELVETIEEANVGRRK